MSDIAERLWNLSFKLDHKHPAPYPSSDGDLLREAAERLRAGRAADPEAVNPVLLRRAQYVSEHPANRSLLEVTFARALLASRRD